MPISYACATSHAPGITAWADAAPAPQKERVYGAFERLRGELDASGADTLIVLTSEHWANFFLDHIGAFCVGRADSYTGPIEPWLGIAKAEIKGDPDLAAEILETSYDNGVEPSFAYELLTAYAPGAEVQRFDGDHSAKLIPAGSDIVLQLHYTANGKTEVPDQTRLGIEVASAAPQKRFMSAVLNAWKWEIPPGDTTPSISDSASARRRALA